MNSASPVSNVALRCRCIRWFQTRSPRPSSAASRHAAPRSGSPRARSAPGVGVGGIDGKGHQSSDGRSPRPTDRSPTRTSTTRMPQRALRRTGPPGRDPHGRPPSSPRHRTPPRGLPAPRPAYDRRDRWGHPHCRKCEAEGIVRYRRSHPDYQRPPLTEPQRLRRNEQARLRHATTGDRGEEESLGEGRKAAQKSAGRVRPGVPGGVADKPETACGTTGSTTRSPAKDVTAQRDSAALANSAGAPAISPAPSPVGYAPGSGNSPKPGNTGTQGNRWLAAAERTRRGGEGWEG